MPQATCNLQTCSTKGQTVNLLDFAWSLLSLLISAVVE